MPSDHNRLHPNYRNISRRLSLQGCKASGSIICCILIVLCLLLLVFSVLIMDFTPPVSRDALTHHLSIPKLWIENGGMVEMPHLHVSYYPMNIELLYVIPMLWGNDILPKYIHFIFALMTAWLIYKYLKKRTTQPLSYLGVFLFLSTPIILKLSTSAYVDLGLIFFSWASIYFLFIWAESLTSLKYLIYAAIFCGLGLGTKYNGLIVLFLLTILVPYLYLHTSERPRHKFSLIVGYVILYLSIALIVFSPWMIRNYHWTKNPIYPLYDHIFNSQTDKGEITNLSMKPWIQRKVIYGETFLETVSIPLRIFFQGEDDNPRLFDGKLNPVLLLMPLLLLIRIGKQISRIRIEQIILYTYVVLFLLFASFMVDMRIRYIAPTIPPLVVLTIFGISHVLNWIRQLRKIKLQRILQWAFIGIVSTFLIMNVSYAMCLFESVDPIPYLLGQVSREEYLKNNQSEYAAIQFSNQIQAEDAKILALFVGRRLYYFDHDVVFWTNRFSDLVKNELSHDKLASQLQRNGFTHCIIGIKLFEHWVNMNFSNDKKLIISEWLKKDCLPLFNKNGYAVFKLNPTDTIY